MVDLVVDHALAARAKLGESPTWCPATQSLYWIDIAAATINRFDPRTGTNQSWTCPSTPGCVVLRDGGLLVAARDGLYDLDTATGAFEKRRDVPYNPALYRFNDGKTDRSGRCLWVGSMPVNTSDPDYIGTGILHRYDGRTITPAIAPITSANGTAFSPDGAILYRAETRGRKIFAYDYDAKTGVAANGRLFAEVPATLGLPDGATVDTQGGYWAALPVGPTSGSVVRFTADGALDFHIEMPVRVPTMVAFGGTDMTTLYVTSARLETEYGLPEHPRSGDLFAIETPFQGIVETPFRPRP